MSARTSSEDAVGRWLGKTIDGRYRIESELGAGGLGMVFRATHLALERPVAVKVLHPELLPSSALRQRFQREVKTLSLLAHPHIVTPTDSGVLDDGSGYLVMELLEGKSLEDRLKEGPILPDEAIALGRQVLLALVEAHAKGILHRDIKPANVFLQPLASGGAHVKLLDFGLAKVRSDIAAEPGAYPTLTADGTIVGTPTYMAPEQAAAVSADPSSDVYSVGVVLYEMLTDRPPFVHESKLELVRAHLGKPVPEMSEVCPALTPTPELRQLIATALEKDRLQRFPSAREMLTALDALPSPAARRGEAPAPPVKKSVAISGTEQTVSLKSSELATVDSLPKKRAPVRERKRFSFPRLPARASMLAAAAAIALVGLAIGVWALWPSDRENPTTSTADDTDTPPILLSDGGVATSVERPSVPTTTAATSINPFDAPTPEELRDARREIFRGRRLSESQQRAMWRYRRSHPNDPRPFLLLARHHRFKGEYRPMVRYYRNAHRTDRRITGFRPMFPDLMRAAGDRSAGNAAVWAIEQIYGRSALPAVQRALSRRSLGSAERRRLERLRNRID